jgi:hypothetical protein
VPSTDGISTKQERVGMNTTSPQVDVLPIHDYALFVSMTAIMKTYFDVAKKVENPSMFPTPSSNGLSWPNVQRNRTRSGFFVEFIYDVPTYLHTPWGEIQFVEGAMHYGHPWPLVREQFIELIGGEMVIPHTIGKFGQYGLVYSVGKICDISLPNPTFQDYPEYVVEDTIYDAFYKLLNRYNEEFGQFRIS